MNENLTPATSPVPTVRRGPRKRDTLGLLWLHGTLHAATFRKQAIVSDWIVPTPVTTLDEFEATLDQILTTLKFTGSEMFLVL